jgi:uncharacterized glyoxalase superfamily protein PhnB
VHKDGDGSIAHAVLKLGAGRILLSSDRKQKSERQGIYIHVKEVDALFHRAVAAGADISMPLTDQDYGSREFGVRDAEGREWCFGTYLPGKR